MLRDARLTQLEVGCELNDPAVTAGEDPEHFPSGRIAQSPEGEIEVLPVADIT